MEAKTKKQNNNNSKMFPRWFQAHICLLELVLRTGLHLQSLSVSETRQQFDVLTKADMRPSHKQIKWCRLFSPPDICDLFSFEELNKLVPVFPKCVKEDHFPLLYRRTEGNK